MKHFLITTLVAAIGIVGVVSQSRAATAYCELHPQEPNCGRAYDRRGTEPQGKRDTPTTLERRYEEERRDVRPRDRVYEDEEMERFGDRRDDRYDRERYDRERYDDRRDERYDDRRYDDRKPRREETAEERRDRECRRVGFTLRDRGYYRVRPVDCSGSNYKYQVIRDGVRYLVKTRKDGRIVYQIPN